MALNIFSPNDMVLTALAREPLADKTVELMTREFTSAYKQVESWVQMQQLQLSIDRVSAIKEERGRYYVGFSSEHEVLRCLSDSVSLYVDCRFVRCDRDLIMPPPQLQRDR